MFTNLYVTQEVISVQVAPLSRDPRGFGETKGFQQ
jgi:hypothetical protein